MVFFWFYSQETFKDNEFLTIARPTVGQQKLRRSLIPRETGGYMDLAHNNVSEILVQSFWIQSGIA
jgi:hypothetical protein